MMIQQKSQHKDFNAKSVNLLEEKIRSMRKEKKRERLSPSIKIPPPTKRRIVNKNKFLNVDIDQILVILSSTE